MPRLDDTKSPDDLKIRPKYIRYRYRELANFSTGHAWSQRRPSKCSTSRTILETALTNITDILTHS